MRRRVGQNRPGLVLEIAFDAVQISPRYKSGVAMWFPRVHRIRWDKPLAEAETAETLYGHHSQVMSLADDFTWTQG